MADLAGPFHVKQAQAGPVRQMVLAHKTVGRRKNASVSRETVTTPGHPDPAPTAASVMVDGYRGSE